MRYWAARLALLALIEVASTSSFLSDTEFLCLSTLDSYIAAVQLLSNNSQQLNVTGGSTSSFALLAVK